MRVIAKIKDLPGGCHNWVMDDSKFPAISAGFGSGKTHHFITKAIRAMEQNAGLMGPMTPGLLMEPTFSMVEDILVPQFRDRMDTFGIPHSYNAQKHRLIIPSWLGGRPAHILFQSAENYERARGKNAPFFGIDEVDTIRRDKAKGMWRILTSRLRVPNSTQQGFVSSTPEGFQFMWSRWDKVNLKSEKQRKWYTLHRASTRDNYHNPPDYIEQLLENYDERIIKAYIDGLFVNLAQGSVYESFDMGGNVNEGVTYYPKRQLHLFFDFNVNPLCAGAAHIVKPEGRPQEIHVVREFILHSSKTEKMCRHIIEEVGDHEGHVFVYGDASGANSHTSATESDLAIINRMLGGHFEDRGGYTNRFMRSNPRRRSRYASTNSMLLNSKGQRRVFAHPTAETLVSDWIALSYDEGSNDPDTQGETIGHISSAFDYFVFWHWPEKERSIIRQGKATA